MQICTWWWHCCTTGSHSGHGLLHVHVSHTTHVVTRRVLTLSCSSIARIRSTTRTVLASMQWLFTILSCFLPWHEEHSYATSIPSDSVWASKIWKCWPAPRIEQSSGTDKEEPEEQWNLSYENEAILQRSCVWLCQKREREREASYKVIRGFGLSVVCT